MINYKMSSWYCSRSPCFYRKPRKSLIIDLAKPAAIFLKQGDGDIGMPIGNIVEKKAEMGLRTLRSSATQEKAFQTLAFRKTLYKGWIPTQISVYPYPFGYPVKLRPCSCSSVFP
jgi:hypothetical protein